MADSLLAPADLDSELLPLLEAPHWYVGFSGGLDSTVLLHLLQRWRQRHPGAPPLGAIHINHGLQPAAHDWQTHCEWLCRLLRLPLVCLGATVERGGPKGLEAAAREARYSLFEAQLGEGDVLFLGHHEDDQVETFFLRLLRGAGVTGLSAMPAGRALGRGMLARPLLGLSRAQLEHYAAQQGLSFVEDPSNCDAALDRNYLRTQVLPLLAARWPGYRSTVGRASGHIAAAAGLLAELVPAPGTVRSVMGDPGVALADLNGAPAGEAALVLRHWLQAGCLPAPDRPQLEEFLRQLRDADEQARPRLACSAFVLQRHRDAVYLLPEGAQVAPDPVVLPVGGGLDLPGVGRLTLQEVMSEGLLLAPGESLSVRWRQGGERCRPRGRTGSRSLKKLLQEADIPPWWRDRVPLLYLGDELLAVGDLWLCESSRWGAAPAPGRSLWQPGWTRNISTAFD
jgi:tRNA(Ile)-lysidine synthase